MTVGKKENTLARSNYGYEKRKKELAKKKKNEEKRERKLAKKTSPSEVGPESAAGGEETVQPVLAGQPMPSQQDMAAIAPGIPASPEEASK
jgi:hypothetical protein